VSILFRDVTGVVNEPLQTFQGDPASQPDMPLFATVAALLFLLSPGRQGTSKQISRKNFKIAGITLGVTTDHDLERIWGPAPAMETADHEGARRCYLSTSGDGTVLEIESWVGTAIEFRLDSRPDGTENKCAKSGLVSRKLETGTGLKLGLPPEQVMAALGRPTAVKGSSLVYEESFDRPLTLREKLRLKESGRPWEVKSTHVMNKIEIGLSAGKVVSIIVLHNETD
jgi:hypothetical protein